MHCNEEQNYAGQDRDAHWARLREALSGVVAAMTDPAESDLLVINMPASEGQPVPYVQAAAFGEGEMLRIEAVGDAFLPAERQSTPEFAELMRRLGWRGNDETNPNWYADRQVVQAVPAVSEILSVIREGFGVAFTNQLEFHVSGPVSDRGTELEAFEAGRKISDPVVDLLGARRAEPLSPASRRELIDLVARVVREHSGTEPLIEGDSVFTVNQYGNNETELRVHLKESMIEIIRREPNKYPEGRSSGGINSLNRGNPFIKWQDRTFYIRQSIVVPCAPFVPGQLDQMLTIFDKGIGELRWSVLAASPDWG